MEITHIYGSAYAAGLGKASVPILLQDKTAVLLDSGERESPALLDWLERKDITVTDIICSHLHYDHFMNNSALYSRFSCRVWAPEGEPYTEIVPHQETPLIRYAPGSSIETPLGTITAISTPGHSPMHQCLVTPEGLCYLGDLVMTEDMLCLAKLPYVWDQEMATASAEKLRGSGYALYYAAHAGCIEPERLDAVLDRNLEKNERMMQGLLEYAAEQGPMPKQDFIRGYMQRLGIMSDIVLNSRGRQASLWARVIPLLKRGLLHEENGLIGL